jgi:hypothetical protein
MTKVLTVYKPLDDKTAAIRVRQDDGTYTEALVDLEDAPMIGQFNWKLDAEGYPVAFLIDRYVRMHHMVLALDAMRKEDRKKRRLRVK